MSGREQFIPEETLGFDAAAQQAKFLENTRSGRDPEKVERLEPQQHLLEPGGDSVVGFLGEGQSLNEVRMRDNEMVENLGYTHQELAELLRGMIREVSKQTSFDQPYGEYTATNGKQYVGFVVDRRGPQNCPWKDEVDAQANPSHLNFYLVRKEDLGGSEEWRARKMWNWNTYKEKTVLFVGGLLPHLIEEHQFYEGSTPYRVAPEDIVEVLGKERVPGSIERAKGVPISGK